MNLDLFDPMSYHNDQDSKNIEVKKTNLKGLQMRSANAD
jgi:hypothetical protein